MDVTVLVKGAFMQPTTGYLRAVWTAHTAGECVFFTSYDKTVLALLMAGI